MPQEYVNNKRRPVGRFFQAVPRTAEAPISPRSYKTRLCKKFEQSSAKWEFLQIEGSFSCLEVLIYVGLGLVFELVTSRFNVKMAVSFNWRGPLKGL